MVRATLDSSLRIDLQSIPDAVCQQVLGALRFANPAKEIALREKIWNAANMLDEIEMYEYSGNDLVLPRGFYGKFLSGAQALGLDVEWVDNRRFYEFFPLTTGEAGLTPISLYDYQKPAVHALVTYEQGILEMPTGGGKTVCVMEALRRTDQPTLIIVDRASLAQQWREQIHNKLGTEAGYIGESAIDVRTITVALRQALIARWDDLAQDKWNLLGLINGTFFDLWGTLVLDEVHHAATSGTLQELIAAFPARFRWGVSATPDRDPGWFPVVEAVIGPVIHQTIPQDLGERLVTPSVRVLTSDFEFEYIPTQIVDLIDHLGNPVISPRTGRPKTTRVQNNYGAMLKALCEDDRRNTMIMREVILEAEAGHHVLIVSKRKEHLRRLHSMITESDQLLVQSLYGGESGKKKTEVGDAIEAAPGGSILFSTVADEALDFPRLDRVFLIYPTRNVSTAQQIYGRVMRVHPKKKDAVIFDVWDQKMGLLSSQFRDRRMYYNMSGYPVHIPTEISA